MLRPLRLARPLVRRQFTPALLPRAPRRHFNSSQASEPENATLRVIQFSIVFSIAAAGFWYLTAGDRDVSSLDTEAMEEAATKLRPTKAVVQDAPSGANLSSSPGMRESWENPGLYLWGSNVGKVIDPKGKSADVKVPTRVPFFDGKLLKDVKLREHFGAAVLENGDLVQWGTGYSASKPEPTVTLKGKGIAKITVSNDRVIAVGSNGTVYSLPASKNDLEGGLKEQESSKSWNPFKGVSAFSASVNYRNITPAGLGRMERVVDVAAGLEHCLILTSKGRVFSAAASTQEFPSSGQMGVPGLTWETRPAGCYDQAHEIPSLMGIKVDKIAAGDFHSVVLDKTGTVHTFGDNSFGQLGFPSKAGRRSCEKPGELVTKRMYKDVEKLPKAVDIAAGGSTTYIVTEAPDSKSPTVDVWACGQGNYGNHGNGKWTHVLDQATKVKTLSSLTEYNESKRSVQPLKPAYLTVGTTHAAAVVPASASADFGADVMFWGGNEHWQLGNDKRTNSNTPGYVGPLDGRENEAQNQRLQLAQQQKASVNGRKTKASQRVECGQLISGVYSTSA